VPKARRWISDDAYPQEKSQGEVQLTHVIGRIEGKHWSAVVTYRGEVVRIISVRRSRAEEVIFYEG
jgi:hypothetical protein